jgi:hypothetical protein
VISDAHHEVGRFICCRYSCSLVSEIDTEMGAMCREHSSPLLFPVFIHDPWKNPTYVPWEFMKPHERQAQTNHGMQTLARLSERGGVSVAEALCILRDREWSIPFGQRDRSLNVAEFETILDDWQRARGPV